MIDYSAPKDHITKVVLDNGMTILLFVNKAVPKVLMQVAYEVGSAVEEPGEKGLAHLIEHMIFKGTDKLKEGDIDSIARKFGASFNAFTSKEVTSYYFEMNKNNWKPFVGILADCMKNARFDEQHLASEMRAVLQELRMRKDNYWVMMLEKADALMYPANHPYHYPIIGYKQDLVTLSAAKLRDFYEKYYHPNKATFFVVGDIDPEAVVAEIKQHFESIPSGTSPTTYFPSVKKDVAVHESYLYQAIQSEQVGCFWHTPGKKEVKHILLEAVAHLLSGGPSSRLFTRLVDKEKVAISISPMAYQLNEDGVFFILFEPHSGQRDRCIELIREELTIILNEGVEADELAKMVATKQRTFFSMMQNPQKLAYSWINSYFSTRDEFDLFTTVKQLDQITSDDISSFVKTHLDPVLLSSVTVSPLTETMQESWKKIQQQHEEFERKLLAANQRTAPLEKPEFVQTMAEPEALDFSFPKPDRQFVLPNGLKVLLTKNEPWPVLSIACHLRDADYFARAREGVGIQVMMDMLVEGSVGYTKEENIDFFEKYGARFTSNRSGIYLTALNTNSEKVIERFIHVMTKPNFMPDAFEKIKNIAKDTYTRSKDNPRLLAQIALKNKIYANHPYEWTFDDAIADLNALKIEQLDDMHKQIIGAEQMVLSIAGSFDVDAMEQTVRKLFGHLDGKQYHEKLVPEAHFASDPVDIQLLRDQAVLVFGRPSPLTLVDEDFIPVQLLNYIAFTSLGSRVYKLREQTGLFYAAGGSWAAHATKRPGFDSLFTLLSPHTLTDAETKIRAMLNELGSNGVTRHEIKAAQQMYLKTMIDLVSSNAAICALMANLETLGLTPEFYDKALVRVQSISREELNEIATKYFHDRDLARIRVGRV